jgi:hypothetical protein
MGTAAKGFFRPRKGSIYSWRCPRCSAGPGSPCIGAEGERLPGVHFERNRQRRQAIAAAFDLYRPSAGALSFKKINKYP